MVTTGGTASTFYYALPSACPSVCAINGSTPYCSAGCLFTSSSGYTGARSGPLKSLAYNTTGLQGSWLSLSTNAICASGGSVGAVTGSLVTTSGLTGTYAGATGTRVYSATSSCGTWTLRAV